MTFILIVQRTIFLRCGHYTINLLLALFVFAQQGQALGRIEIKARRLLQAPCAIGLKPSGYEASASDYEGRQSTLDALPTA
jgi:hypothetical protein